MAQKYDYVFEFFKKMAGGEYLGFNNSVFLSERDSADRNFALAYFLRENLCFPPGDVNIPNILDFQMQFLISDHGGSFQQSNWSRKSNTKKWIRIF